MSDDDIFDLDALDREANKQPFRFRFDGEVYTCADDVSIEMIQKFEENDILAAVEVMLGADQWARIVSSDKTFGVQRMGEVLTAYARHLGIELPNSSGSTVSSLPTARR